MTPHVSLRVQTVVVTGVLLPSSIPNLKYHQIKSSSQATTFESLAFTVGGRSTAAVLLVYRPGSQQVSDLFFEELTRYLEVLALYKCQIVIAGDFNIHVERNDDRDAVRLLDLFASFDCTQHVHEPTHARGGTLDHVFTRHDETVFDVGVDPAGMISDHSFITWKMHFISQPPRVVWNTFRCWRKVEHSVFQQALRESELCREIPDDASPDTLFATYDEVLRKLADRFAPAKKVKIRRQPIAVWYDDESRVLRRKS